MFKNTPNRSAAALLVAGALALTGCQAPADDSTTKLSFFSWDGEAAMQPVIEAFEEEHSDIEIEFSNAPPVAEYVSTLQTRLLSGTAADVFLIAAENRTNIIDGGYAVDLSGKPFMEPVAPFNAEAYSDADGTYGMSVASWGGGVVVNEELLESVGVQEFPADWEGFLDLCEKLEAAGIEPYYDNLQEIPMTLNALVGERFDGDAGVDAALFAGETTFEEQWTPALETFNELFERGLVSKDVVGLDGQQITSEFVNGRVAMIPTGPWSVGTIRAGAPELEFAFHPFPSAGGDGYLPGAASPGYAINSKTENLEQAEEFLTFLSSEEGVRLYNESTAAITTTSNFDPVVDESLEAIVPGIKDGNVYLASIAWPRHQDALSSEAVARLQEMVLGRKSPVDVAAALDAKLAESD